MIKKWLWLFKKPTLCVLTHTHTDCSDIWQVHLDSYSKYCNKLKHYYLVNSASELPNELLYDENIKYTERIISALESIKEEFVIIDFEDMFLTDTVNINKLNKIIKLMVKKDIPFVRLIKSGIKGKSEKYKKCLFKIKKSDLQFSLTPTIWKKDVLLKKMEYFRNMDVWQLERASGMLSLDEEWKGLYYYDNDPKRGGHFDSSIYPHICSAIFKGKWNRRDYPEEINNIAEEYGIDLNKRGFHK